MPGPAPEFRAGFSTRLLSRCYAAEAAEFVAILEKGVRDNPVGVSPGPTWCGPAIDTLLVFYDGKLVAGLCIRKVAMLDPLVIVGDLGPVPARLLDYMRLRAEGMLLPQGVDEYYFCVPVGNSQPSWLRILTQMGGTENLSDDGIELFRRKL